MADSQGAPAGSKTPSDFLKSIKGKPVIVKLNSGVDYRGAQLGLRGLREQTSALYIAKCSKPCGGNRSLPLLLSRALRLRRNAASAHGCCLPLLSTPGILACLDGYMNIAMEQTEEYVNGQLKNKYGDCFIRGNNGEAALRRRSRTHCHLRAQAWLSNMRWRPAPSSMLALPTAAASRKVWENLEALERMHFRRALPRCRWLPA